MKKTLPAIVTSDAWSNLRSFTKARIALGHAGESLPTHEHLRFQLDHARARDAVHYAVNFAKIARQTKGFQPLLLESQASSRIEYLRRPDLGRRLSTGSLLQCQELPQQAGLVLLVIGDGLSGTGIERHSILLAEMLQARLGEKLSAVLPFIRNARVAVADEVAKTVGAKLVVHIIGERPGLSSAESLGAYLTFDPHLQTTDNERNCVSNICPEGLALAPAADKIAYLVRRCVLEQQSGLALKDEQQEALPYPQKENP